MASSTDKNYGEILLNNLAKAETIAHNWPTKVKLSYLADTAYSTIFRDFDDGSDVNSYYFVNPTHISSEQVSQSQSQSQSESHEKSTGEPQISTSVSTPKSSEAIIEKTVHEQESPSKLIESESVQVPVPIESVPIPAQSIPVPVESVPVPVPIESVPIPVPIESVPVPVSTESTAIQSNNSMGNDFMIILVCANNCTISFHYGVELRKIIIGLSDNIPGLGTRHVLFEKMCSFPDTKEGHLLKDVVPFYPCFIVLRKDNWKKHSKDNTPLKISEVFVINGEYEDGKTVLIKDNKKHVTINVLSEMTTAVKEAITNFSTISSDTSLAIRRGRSVTAKPSDYRIVLVTTEDCRHCKILKSHLPKINVELHECFPNTLVYHYSFENIKDFAGGFTGDNVGRILKDVIAFVPCYLVVSEADWKRCMTTNTSLTVSDVSVINGVKRDGKIIYAAQQYLGAKVPVDISNPQSLVKAISAAFDSFPDVSYINDSPVE